MTGLNCPHCGVKLDPREWLIEPDAHFEDDCPECGEPINVYFDLLVQKGFTRATRPAPPTEHEGEGRK